MLQPKSFVIGQSQTNVLPFQYVSKNGNVKTLSEAYDRNNKLIFNHAVDDAKHANKAVYKVEVSVADNSEAYPQLTTDESYSLHIPSPSESGPAVITLTAKTIYGAMHGLQSLSQLVVYDFDADSYFIPSTPMQIEDAPRYPHRGKYRFSFLFMLYRRLVLNYSLSFVFLPKSLFFTLYRSSADDHN